MCVCVFVAQVKCGTLKEENIMGRKCRESRENVLATFKQEVARIKCHENSNINMLLEFKVGNYWKGGEIQSKNTHN